METATTFSKRSTTKDPATIRLLWYIFAGSRGGLNRTRIIDLLMKRPYNMNQLSEALGLNYRAVQHHVGVLEKNNLVCKAGERYGILYFISTYLEYNLEAFQDMRSKILQCSIVN